MQAILWVLVTTLRDLQTTFSTLNVLMVGATVGASFMFIVGGPSLVTKVSKDAKGLGTLGSYGRLEQE